MQSRWYWLGGAALVCAFAGCMNLSEPSDAVFSLGEITLPSPGVVIGDTMRDSTGQVAPLHVVAYGKSGDSVDATLTFISIDTNSHTVGALLIGDHLASTAQVIASAAAIQSLPVAFAVTLSPDTLVAADSTLHHHSYVPTGDSVVASADLTTRVLHLPDSSGVDAVIVRYTITRAPPAGTNGPVFVLVNGNALSDRDTTSGGVAARTLRLRLNAGTTAADTAVVTATASYRGQSIGAVEFTVVFTTGS